MKNSAIPYKLKQVNLILEDNDYEYTIPLSKLEKSSSPETIEAIQLAAIEAIRRM